MHPYGYPPPPLPQQQQQQQQSHPHRPQPLHQTAWSTAAPGATSSTRPPLPSFPPREPAPVPTAAVKGKAPKRANPAPVVAASEGGSEPEKKKRKRTGFACRASSPSPCCALDCPGPDPTDGLPLLLSPWVRKRCVSGLSETEDQGPGSSSCIVSLSPAADPCSVLATVRRRPAVRGVRAGRRGVLLPGRQSQRQVRLGSTLPAQARGTPSDLTHSIPPRSGTSRSWRPRCASSRAPPRPPPTTGPRSRPQPPSRPSRRSQCSPPRSCHRRQGPPARTVLLQARRTVAPRPMAHRTRRRR
jgi:hypothetical protein